MILVAVLTLIIVLALILGGGLVTTSELNAPTEPVQRPQDRAFFEFELSEGMWIPEMKETVIGYRTERYYDYSQGSDGTISKTPVTRRVPVTDQEIYYTLAEGFEL